MAETFEEHRRFQRIRRQWFVRFQLAGDPDVPWSMGRIKNLGAGGLCFSTDQALEPTTRLRFKMDLPVAGEQCVVGVIAWRHQRAEQYDYGIAFEKLTSPQQAALQSVVDALIKRRP